MAKLSVNGLGSLMLSLEQVAAIPDDVVRDMLDAEAQVVEEAQVSTGMQMGVYRTGETLRSIRRGKLKKDRDGIRTVSITFSGTNDKGERNAAVAFINEYGKRGQPARPFIATANAAAADSAVEEAEKVYNKFLQDKGF